MGLEISQEEKYEDNNNWNEWEDNWRQREEERRQFETCERKRKEEEDRAYEERRYRTELEDLDRERRLSMHNSRF